jgi:type III secretion protein Q
MTAMTTALSGPVLDAVSPLHKHLRDVPAAAAAASRLLHDRRLAPLWNKLALAGDLTLHPVAAPGRTRLFTLALECDAGRFALALASADDAALTIAAGADLAENLRALAAMALFGEFAQRLGELALPGVQAASVRTLALEDSPTAGWCALRRGGLELGRVAVQQLPREVHDQLGAAARRVARGHAWRGPLRLSAHVSIAWRGLSVRLLRSLATGDVLLLPLAGLDGAAGRLRLGTLDGLALVAPGAIEGDTFRISGAPCMTDDDLNLAADAGVEPDSLDELELPVRFELETVNVSLGDLEAIQPGYVIELAMPVAQASLRLVSCGHVIGHADLVSVSGRLGARITKLVARDDADQHHG